MTQGLSISFGLGITDLRPSDSAPIVFTRMGPVLSVDDQGGASPFVFRTTDGKVLAMANISQKI